MHKRQREKLLDWSVYLVVFQGPQGFIGPAGEPGEPGAAVSISNQNNHLFLVLCYEEVEFDWKHRLLLLLYYYYYYNQ